MTTLPQNDLVAIGVLASQLQKPVRTIEAACIELNIAPAMRINFVPHFDADQIERLTERLADGAAPLKAAHVIKGLNYHAAMPDLPRR